MRGPRPRRRALVLTLVSAVVLGCAVAGVAVAAVLVAAPDDEPAAAPTSAPTPGSTGPMSPDVAAAVEIMGAPFPTGLDAERLVGEIAAKTEGWPTNPYGESEVSGLWRCAWEAELLAAAETDDAGRFVDATEHLSGFYDMPVVRRLHSDPERLWFATVIEPVREGDLAPLREELEVNCDPDIVL
ncbi:hypothetical protein [Aeromicrobium massiliense]|uniref:hypothetical protein n=1 Tax=Aeromicrobium massiliense TaxID=1464554 RepID=UPI000313AF7C|nr:hypothetical protein [Aeromicrobium massiliense]